MDQIFESYRLLVPIANTRAYARARRLTYTSSVPKAQIVVAAESDDLADLCHQTGQMTI